MTYRIEYAEGKCCNFAYGRAELLKWLEILRRETITDIRKIYKNGSSQSVMDIYGKFTGGR